jgi:hypothetical protein
LSDPHTRAKLRAGALQISTIASVPLPSTMLAVASGDHQVAEEIVSGGSVVNDHAPVFAVLMTGGAFDPHVESPGPDHMAIPPRPVLTVVIDAQTFMGVDVSFQSTVPDLTLIGPHVVSLLSDWCSAVEMRSNIRRCE